MDDCKPLPLARVGRGVDGARRGGGLAGGDALASDGAGPEGHGGGGGHGSHLVRLDGGATCPGAEKGVWRRQRFADTANTPCARSPRVEKNNDWMTLCAYPIGGRFLGCPPTRSARTSRIFLASAQLLSERERTHARTLHASDAACSARVARCYHIGHGLVHSFLAGGAERAADSQTSPRLSRY